MNVSAVTAKTMSAVSSGSASDVSLEQAKQRLERSISRVEKGEGRPRQVFQLQADLQALQTELRRARSQQAQTSDSSSDPQQRVESETTQALEKTEKADRDNPSNSSDRALDILA
jgi:hypothetical protein